MGIDLTTPNNISGEQFAYRNDSCGTQVATDILRQKYMTAGVPDYNVGWWYSGAWLNYTRTIPTNNYYIYARLASGNGAYTVTNSLVIGGAGTVESDHAGVGNLQRHRNRLAGVAMGAVAEHQRTACGGVTRRYGNALR